MTQRQRVAPTRDLMDIRADLDAMEATIAAARRDPMFLDDGSQVAADHAWASRRAAMLRGELADATRGRR